MAKRNRSDTLSSTVKFFNLTDPKPPAHMTLRDQDWPFWRSICRARAASSWNDSDLELACILARLKADIDRLQHELDAEGYVVEGSVSAHIINPKSRLLDSMINRSITLSRLLHVHASATQGRAAQSGERLKAENKQRSVADSLEDDGLIPGWEH